MLRLSSSGRLKVGVMMETAGVMPAQPNRAQSLEAVARLFGDEARDAHRHGLPKAPEWMSHTRTWLQSLAALTSSTGVA